MPFVPPPAAALPRRRHRFGNSAGTSTSKALGRLGGKWWEDFWENYGSFRKVCNHHHHHGIWMIELWMIILAENIGKVCKRVWKPWKTRFKRHDFWEIKMKLGYLRTNKRTSKLQLGMIIIFHLASPSLTWWFEKNEWLVYRLFIVVSPTPCKKLENLNCERHNSEQQWYGVISVLIA